MTMIFLISVTPYTVYTVATCDPAPPLHRLQSSRSVRNAATKASTGTREAGAPLCSACTARPFQRGKFTCVFSSRQRDRKSRWSGGCI